MDVVPTDLFWAPRLDQLRSETVEVLLERLEAQGALDNFRRLVGTHDGPRRAMHFSDSDVYKWIEAAVLAGRFDLADPVIDLVIAAQQPDGYIHTNYVAEGVPKRYSDLDFGHEHYCFGHLIEAAVTHHSCTGSDRLLNVALRVADHLCELFGPDGDERTDAHPEVELALCRLASATGEGRYVDQAALIIERRLHQTGTSLEEFEIGGHAVRNLYLVSGIAEVALATGEARWGNAATRLFRSVVDEHSYPTGAVGGRWLGEATGRPFEQPDAMAYAETCAAVAAAQLSWRMWRLTRDPVALDHLELLLFNAVPAGVGADGASWFYSQPQAVNAVGPDPNPWVYDFDYGLQMLSEWFPAHRHEWFDVPCCPPNLARMFAQVPDHVAEVDASGDLLVHLPIACQVTGGGWDVTVDGGYPFAGDVTVTVHAAPAGASVRLRRPGWGGGSGHEPLAVDGMSRMDVEWVWWSTSHRVEGGGRAVHLRRGPVVYCLDGVDHPGVDLRDLVVDPTRGGSTAFGLVPDGHTRLHRPFSPAEAAVAVPTTPRPYAEWGNAQPSTMRMRFPVGLVVGEH